MRSTGTTTSSRRTSRRCSRTSGLQIIDRPSFNVGYVTINQAVKPFDDIRVRQAVAYGLDRASVVGSFYAGRGTGARSNFEPPSVQGYNAERHAVPVQPGQGASSCSRRQG